MRFLKPLFYFLLVITFFSACKKNTDSFDTTPNFYFINGGTSGFEKSLILFPASDTITYNLIISSTYILTNATTINLAVNDNYRQNYNTTNGTYYNAMPSTAYSFPATITANAGSVYDTIPITIYKQNLLNNKFILPISITSVSNYKIDTTSSVIYINTNDNQLSGIYSSKVSKFIYTGDAIDSNLTSIDTFTMIKNLIPISDTTSELDYADLGPNGWKYEITYAIDGSGFTVKPNSVITNSVQEGSFNIITATFDIYTKNLYLKSSYKNSSGNERIVEESLTLY